MSEFNVKCKTFSIGSAASMMESKRIIESTPKVGSISVYTDSPKILKENLLSVECKHLWQYM